MDFFKKVAVVSFVVALVMGGLAASHLINPILASVIATASALIGMMAVVGANDIYQYPICPMHNNNLCTQRVNTTTAYCRKDDLRFAA